MASAFIWLTVGDARSQTIEWGSVVDIDIVDSKGTVIPGDGSFRFELGAFSIGFVPSDANIDLWSLN